MVINSAESYWKSIWRQFKKRWYGTVSLYVILLFCLVGIYAPFLASSKPFCVYYEGEWYFPLFRYLFYRGFYTKSIDLFFNLWIFFLPLGMIAWGLLRKNQRGLASSLLGLSVLYMLCFFYIEWRINRDPAADPKRIHERKEILKKHPLPSWSLDLNAMSPYAKLNLLLREKQRLEEKQRYEKYKTGVLSLWEQERQHEEEDNARQEKKLASAPEGSAAYTYAEAKLKYNKERRRWINENRVKLHFILMPLVRPFHWEEDAGGEQSLNQFVPWWELTRINHKDLTAALIFGIRISLVVGLLSVGIALLIGIPVGAQAGFYGGTFDIIVSRLLEIWESMPLFFMLLFVVAITQSKSIFIVIALIGLFGWTAFSRYVRGEFFKQRNLPYVEACKALGLSDRYVMFFHILPNAIPPVLTLLPFAIMGAITSEAGLSFLGLGEEGSCSWGVLMDEGRRAFPGESYLLWPPALLLTFLLVAIALVGDTLRDSLDPKLHK